MRIITIINQKGGCGKTTTAINLVSSLARQGVRCVLVDMDPQSHCAAGLGVPEHRIDLDVADALLTPFEQPLETDRLVWRVAKNYDLIPSRARLAGLEAARGALAEVPDKEQRLRQMLGRLEGGYDVAVIDCAPSIGLLAYNALTAADQVIIPVETGYFAIQGADRQISTIRALARRLGTATPVWLLPTLHHESSAVATDLLGELKRRFGDQVIPLVVRHDAKLREATSFGRPIDQHAPDSSGCADYANLARWFLSAIGTSTRAAAELTPREPEPPFVHVLAEGMALTPRPGSFPAGPSLAGRDAEGPAPVSRAAELALKAQRFHRQIDLIGGEAPSEIPTALRLDEPAPASRDRVHPSVAPLLGVRCVPQGVLFVQPLTLGRWVCVAGDFNNWSTTSHPMQASDGLGIFQLCVKLSPGRQRYRLVIDGRWAIDAHNPHTEPGLEGAPSSVVVVSESNVRAVEPA